ncbi:succinylglutamate desuccinylase/aspartoacylase family protein [Castellaniella sp.]|uniref:succinylglutamate desuccinylase/aspartoacylase family protein n=1 Tax=Castellaniella sp. TaxID=1955812 RepID=UPI0035652FDE
MSQIAVLKNIVAPGHSRVDIPVAQIASGYPLKLTAHVIRGAQDGPTMVITGVMHGDEFGSIPVLLDFIKDLDPAHIKGAIVILPVANPLALGALSRFTPDVHGNTDLHAVFPGSPGGTLTQKMAAAINTNLIQGLTPDDLFVDIHSGGAGGRLQFRVDYDNQLAGALKERVVDLCRAYGTRLIHENNLAGTSSRVANSLGVPTINVEVGGSFLDEPSCASFTERGVRGLRAVAAMIGVLDGERPAHKEQWVYDTVNRIEVNPQVGGYLISYKPAMEDLDHLITEGTLLGEVVDPHSLEVVDRLVAPVDGFLFFTRRSGIVEAGGKVFGLARASGSLCLR